MLDYGNTRVGIFFTGLFFLFLGGIVIYRPQLMATPTPPKSYIPAPPIIETAPISKTETPKTETPHPPKSPATHATETTSTTTVATTSPTTSTSTPLVTTELPQVTLKTQPETVITGGLQFSSQVWQGVIRITGSVVFSPWTTLTIKPGTKIIFEKKPDIAGTDWTDNADAYTKDHNDPTGRSGYRLSHYSITGTITAIGTKEEPIIFTSAEEKPDYADWDQLILLEGSILDHVEISYAHNGILTYGDNVTIKNSKIQSSLWSCIDLFSTGNIIENNEIFHCWHQAIGIKKQGQNTIKDNLIHDVWLGINCENGANPTITGNAFRAAPQNNTCQVGGDNTILEAPPDSLGGTYGGVLIYPTQKQN
ncbi:MAG: right-handed parallel beta-helix repeat-containing protein [Patescibacteria group bacterium]